MVDTVECFTEICVYNNSLDFSYESIYCSGSYLKWISYIRFSSCEIVIERFTIIKNASSREVISALSILNDYQREVGLKISCK